jgi:hypothetical protein
MVLLSPTNTTIVISSYKRPTDWANKLEEEGFDVRRYTKEDPTSMYNVDKNIGMEASTYLKYCMDTYESLQEYTIFLHDEEFSWHHEGSIIDRIMENIGFEGDYKTLNNVHNLPELYIKYNLGVVQFYNTFMKKYMGDLRQFGEFLGAKRIGAAQMIVSRSAILAHPIQLYTEIYFWMMMADRDDMVLKKEAGILMEYFWGLLFGDVKALTDVPKVAVICDPAQKRQAVYADQFMDFYSPDDIIDKTKYELLLTIDSRIKFVNYDHFYTCLLELSYRNDGFHLIYKGSEDWKFDLVRLDGSSETTYFIDNKEFLFNILGVIDRSV